MRVVGLDLSLTRTGVADDEGTRAVSVKTTGVERLHDLREAITNEFHWIDGLASPLPALVAIEGYNLGVARRGDSAHHLGEIGGIMRLWLWTWKVPYVDVPPASLKKYACGKGNANKGQVLEAASKRSGLDFGGDDNRADAWWLRAMALDHYGSPVVEMPALNRSALAAVPWPELAVAS